jgi:hypothetical protein
MSVSAMTEWKSEDIQAYRAQQGLSLWTEAEAKEFLAAHAEAIEDAMIERGWAVISACIEEEEE